MDKQQVKDSLQFIFDENKVIDEYSAKRLLARIAQPSPKKRKKISLIPAIVTVLLLCGTGIFAATMIPNANQNAVTEDNNMEEYSGVEGMGNTKTVDELEFELSVANGQIEHYKSVIDQMLPSLTDEEKLQLSKSQFTYELRINSILIPSNGQLEVEPGELDILLSFRIPPVNVLPEKWYQKGMISGDFFEHIQNVEPAGGEEIYADGANIMGRGFKFTSLKSGDTISFSVTDELKERLKLETNAIKISVK